MVGMLVPAAVGDEVAVEELTAERAAAWGESLGRLHQEGYTGLPIPQARQVAEPRRRKQLRLEQPAARTP